MVTQNMSRTHEEKKFFWSKKFKYRGFCIITKLKVQGTCCHVDWNVSKLLDIDIARFADPGKVVTNPDPTRSKMPDP